MKNKTASPGINTEIRENVKDFHDSFMAQFWKANIEYEIEKIKADNPDDLNPRETLRKKLESGYNPWDYLQLEKIKK